MAGRSDTSKVHQRRGPPEERDLAIAARPLEDGGKCAVEFKLADDMELPDELADRFKLARQRSKLADTIRGTSGVVKGTY